MNGLASLRERDRPEISAAIAAAFGERTALAERYADLLVTDGITRGVIGPREAERVWERHVLNSVVLADLIPLASVVVDVGSGAGLPGVPLAIARPDLRVILLEPMSRRVAFLSDCVSALGLAQVDVVRGRAEDGLAERVDVVVVRAVASLAALMRLSAGLVKPDGVLLALKGRSAPDEVEQLVEQGGAVVELLRRPAVGEAAMVVRVTGLLSHPREHQATGSPRRSKGRR